MTLQTFLKALVSKEFIINAAFYLTMAYMALKCI